MVRLEVNAFSPVYEVIFGDYKFPLLRFEAGSLIVSDDSGLSYYNTNMFIVSYSRNRCKINNDYEMVNFKSDTSSSNRKISICNLIEISSFGKLVKQFVESNDSGELKTINDFGKVIMRVKENTPKQEIEEESEKENSDINELIIDIYKANLMNLIDKSLDERNETLFMQLTNDLVSLSERI